MVTAMPAGVVAPSGRATGTSLTGSTSTSSTALEQTSSQHAWYSPIDRPNQLSLGINVDGATGSTRRLSGTPVMLMVLGGVSPNDDDGIGIGWSSSPRTSIGRATGTSMTTAGGAASGMTGSAGTAAAVRPAATAMPTDTSDEPAVTAAVPSGMLPSTGAWALHDRGHINRRSLPHEMFRNARTTSASNWVPAQRSNSALAACGLIAFLYERTDVITS